MAGQGRNADGLTGSEPGGGVNVVRFPGDWFGPLGDLVPIGRDADAERDEQDLCGDELNGVAADSFWGEDAEAAHRVGTPAPLSRRRSRPPLRLVLPGGVVAAAVVALALAIVLGSGVQGGRPVRALRNHKSTPTVAKLVAASRPDGSRPKSASSERVRRDRDDLRRDAAIRRVRPTPHRAPVSADARPHELVVTAVKTTAAVSPDPGDLSSPTGLVSPPPSGPQANP